MGRGMRYISVQVDVSTLPSIPLCRGLLLMREGRARSLIPAPQERGQGINVTGEGVGKGLPGWGGRGGTINPHSSC